jgi:formate dehydrogenase gamma subunit
MAQEKPEGGRKLMARADKCKEKYYIRLSLSQRIQHITLVVSFITLMISGLPIRYADAPVAGVLIKSLGGLSGRAHVHRAAAALLIGVCIYHALWTLFSKTGRQEFGLLMPTLQDMREFVQQIKYILGFSNEKPRYGRYNWIHKLEYFSVGWGALVMIVTGAILGGGERSMATFPKWAFDVARVAHSYEALLAFLVIIIWHCYHVHLSAGTFPMSKSWITGLVTERELREDHPLEYEKIVAAEKE